MGLRARNLDHKIIDELRNVLFRKVVDVSGMDLVSVRWIVCRGRARGKVYRVGVVLCMAS